MKWSLLGRMEEWLLRSVFCILLCWGTLFPSQTVGIGDTHLCSSPLGMESSAIPNSALSASSYYVKNVGPETARLNRESQGGAWCPREPISIGVHEWLQVSLNGTHLLSGVQMQGRYSNGIGQEYTEEFQLEYWREGFLSWRKYYRFDGKSVFAGNTDTTNVVTTRLRPPLLAEKVRFVPYSAHRRVVCLRVELLGCQLLGGVVQYSMEQGDIYSEGISLRDESYDGEEGSKWDRRLGTSSHQSADSVAFPHDSDIESANKSGESDSETSDISITTDSSVQVPRIKLSGGLGQLMDKIEGASSFTMDIGYGMGNGWVGWRRRATEKDWIEILFEFDTARVFSHVNILTQNSPSKGVQFFSRCRAHVSYGGIHFPTHSVVDQIPPAMGSEQTQNVTIPLEDKVGRFVKLQLFYRSAWIVLGELYFHSDVFEGNWTVEEDGPYEDLHIPSDTQVPLEIDDLDGSMMETVVGVLTALIMLSCIAGGVVVCTRKMKGTKFVPSAFHFHSSSTERSSGTSFPFLWRHSWNSVPTHILAQSEPGVEGVKDLLLTLAPKTNAGVSTTTHHLNGDANSNQKNNLKPSFTGTANGGGVMINEEDFHKVHNSTNQGQMSPPPSSVFGPTVLSRTLGKKNLLNNFHESQQNNCPSGKGFDSNSSTSGCYSNNASSVSSNSNVVPSNEVCGNRILRMSMKSPAPGCGKGDGELWGVHEAKVEKQIQQDAEFSTGHYNSTLRSSTSRPHKGKVATSTWNISYEGCGRPIRSQRATCISDVFLHQLRLIENLGSCVYGQVHLYDFEGEVEGQDRSIYRSGRLIAKTIKSMSEIRLLSVLDHEHVLQMICVCTELKKPILALYPAPECGDLCSFLSRLTNTPSLSWLLTVASQIASGMNYLESLQLVHKDLAARNCLVEREGTIRITDLAMSCEQYRDDYCHTDQCVLAPFRWWPWESILSGECISTSSSVWSFGVTLWEILTLCRQKPLAHISDHELFSLAEKYATAETCSPSSPQIWLVKPILSPPEIFDLMRECWRKDSASRPTFQHIHLFLEQKCCSKSATAAPLYHLAVNSQ